MGWPEENSNPLANINNNQTANKQLYFRYCDQFLPWLDPNGSGALTDRPLPLQLLGEGTGWGFCCALPLYDHSRCGSHSFHSATLMWLQSLTADTLAEPDTHRCPCRNLEWWKENGFEESRPECRSICFFHSATQTHVQPPGLKPPKRSQPALRQKNPWRENKCLWMF